MYTFDTPEPISVTVELSSGSVRIVATDRADTIVDVRPGDESRKAHKGAAAQARVEFADGRLLVKAPPPRGLGNYVSVGRGDSIDVTIELPAGSQIQGNGTRAVFRSQGRLGDCGFQNVFGNVELDQTGSLDLQTVNGDILVEEATGHVKVSSVSGQVQVHRIHGTVEIGSASGDLSVGEASGDLLLNTGKGRISVEAAHASLRAQTGMGNIRVGEIVRGSVELGTGTGGIEVGVRNGTAAWVDASSRMGTVQNMLDAHDDPSRFDETVELRVRGFRDVVIRRSAVGNSGQVSA
jgi:Putative adhesin